MAHSKKIYSLILISILCLICHAASLASTQIDGAVKNQGKCAEVDVIITLNQARLPGVFPVCIKDRVALFSSNTLNDIGVNVSKLSFNGYNNSLFDLQKLPNSHIEYYPLRLEIDISIPETWLKSNVYSQRNAESKLQVSPVLSGLLINYSLYADQSAGKRSASAWEDIRWMMNRDENLSNSTQTRWFDDKVETTRLDTHYQKDYAENTMTLGLGDETTGGLNGASNLRFGGIRLSSNFNLQPYKTITPDINLVGSAVIPSNVDVYVNNILQTNQLVSPGAFEISGLSMPQGSNTVKIVTTDINGHQTEQILSRYVDVTLLKKGLFAYSISSGFVRQNWGINSWDYSPSPMIIGDLGYGVSDILTMQAHSETDHRLQVMRIGGNWVPNGEFGVFSAQLAQNWGDSPSGRQYKLAYQWAQKEISLSGAYLQSDRNYQDLATQSSFASLQKSTQIFTGTNTMLGNFSVGWMEMTDSNAVTRRYDSLNWSAPNDRWGALRIGAHRETGNDKDYSLWVSYSLALNNEYSFSSEWQPLSDGNHMTTNLSRRTSQRYDVNGMLQYSQADKNTQFIQAGLDYKTDSGDISFGGSQNFGDNPEHGEYLAAQGSVVLLREGFFFAPRIDDAFGLVSTQGISGIPIKLENNLVGETDDNGYLFLDTLNPYQHNRISLATRAIPTEYLFDDTMIDLIPSRQHGGIATFNLNRNRSAEFHVYTSDNTVLPVGSLVYGTPNDDQILTQIGHDGVLYLKNPDSLNTLWVTDPLGQQCKITLNPNRLAQAHSEPFPLVCETEKGRAH